MRELGMHVSRHPMSATSRGPMTCFSVFFHDRLVQCAAGSKISELYCRRTLHGVELGAGKGWRVGVATVATTAIGQSE